MVEGGSWKLIEKKFFNKRGAHLTAAAYHRPTGLLVAGFGNGIFEIFEVYSSEEKGLQEACQRAHPLKCSQIPAAAMLRSSLQRDLILQNFGALFYCTSLLMTLQKIENLWKLHSQ